MFNLAGRYAGRTNSNGVPPRDTPLSAYQKAQMKAEAQNKEGEARRKRMKALAEAQKPYKKEEARRKLMKAAAEKDLRSKSKNKVKSKSIPLPRERAKKK